MELVSVDIQQRQAHALRTAANPLHDAVHRLVNFP